MKLFTLIIIMNLLLVISHKPISHNIQTIQCEDSCLGAFESYVECQDLVLDTEKHNRFVYPISTNPGLATFFQEEDKTIHVDYFQSNFGLHSEINYVKAKLIQLVTNEYKKTKKNKILTGEKEPSDYFEEIKGNIGLFTFWSPCSNCYQLYITLAKQFPKINFFVYFSDYYKDFVKPFLTRKLEDIKNNIIVKMCKQEFLSIYNLIKSYAKKNDINQMLWGGISKFISIIPKNILQNFLRCLYTVSPEGPVPKNLRITQLSLDPFIEDVYDSIAQIGENSLNKILGKNKE